MDNASKALTMAGSVLIALLVIGALLLMFNNLSSYQQGGIQDTRELQIIEFNNQFSTFDRNNIRGNELYSLLNKVIDYNKRKTIEGDDGAIEIGYEPMTIKFSLKSKDGTKDRKSFTIDNISRLFTTNDYIVEKNANTFEDYVEEEIGDIEQKYGKNILIKLTTGITRIFIDETSETKKNEAINSFNNISTKVKIDDFDDIKSGSETREEIYKYYEFIQFKRANFDCTSCEYDKNTGRIIKMEFVFNGKFQ